MSEPHDFYALKEAGHFSSQNEGADFLRDHPEDPYWLAHQLCNPFRDWSSETFMEAWALARELKQEWSTP